MADNLYNWAKGAAKVVGTGSAAVTAPFLIPRATEELMVQGLEVTPDIVEGAVEGAKEFKDLVNTTPEEAALREYNKEQEEPAKREGWKGFMDEIFLADKKKDYSLGETPVAALLRTPDDAIKVATDTAHGLVNISDTADTLWKTAKGTAQYADPTEGDKILNYIFDIKGDYRPYAKGLVDTYKDKYGSYQDVKNTIATKPVEAALDASIIPGFVRSLFRAPGVIKEGAERAYKTTSKDNPKQTWDAVRSFIRGDNRKPGYIEDSFNKLARKLGEIIEEGSFEAVGVTSGVGKAPLINRYKAAKEGDKDYLARVKEGVKNKDINLGNILSEEIPKLREQIAGLKSSIYDLPEDIGRVELDPDTTRMLKDELTQGFTGGGVERYYSPLLANELLPGRNISINDIYKATEELTKRYIETGRKDPLLEQAVGYLSSQLNRLLTNPSVTPILKEKNLPNTLEGFRELSNSKLQTINQIEEAFKLNSDNPNEIISAFDNFIKGKDVVIPEELAKGSSGLIGAIYEANKKSANPFLQKYLPEMEGTRQREYFPQDFVRSGAGGALALAGMTLTPGGLGVSGVVPFSPRFSGAGSELAGRFLPNAEQYGRAGTALARTAFTTNLADNIEFQREKNEYLDNLKSRYGLNN